MVSVSLIQTTGRKTTHQQGARGVFGALHDLRDLAGETPAHGPVEAVQRILRLLVAMMPITATVVAFMRSQYRSSVASWTSSRTRRARRTGPRRHLRSARSRGGGAVSIIVPL